VSLALWAIFLWPIRSSESETQSQATTSEDDLLMANKSAEMDYGVGHLETKERDVIDQESEKHQIAIRDRSFKQQLFTWEFVLALPFTAAHLLWLNTYLGTTQDRMSDMTDDATLVQRLVQIFSVLLPASFIVSPLIGWIIQANGDLFSLWLVQLLACIFVALNFVHVAWLQVVTFADFSVYRGFFFAALLTYIVNVFGFTNMGKIWGLVITIGGSSNVLQYVLLEITFSVFGGSFLFIDILSAITIMFVSCLPIYLGCKGYR